MFYFYQNHLAYVWSLDCLYTTVNCWHWQRVDGISDVLASKFSLDRDEFVGNFLLLIGRSLRNRRNSRSK